MDNPLIDDVLNALLRMPLRDRTAEALLGLLAFIAQAAGLNLGEATNLQLEHLKLHASTRLLAREIGASAFQVSLTLHSSEVGAPHLTAYIWPTLDDDLDPEPVTIRAHAFTAEQAIKAMRLEIEQQAREAAAA